MPDIKTLHINNILGGLGRVWLIVDTPLLALIALLAAQSSVQTLIHSQCCFVHLHLQQWLIQSSSLVSRDAIFVDKS